MHEVFLAAASARRRVFPAVGLSVGMSLASTFNPKPSQAPPPPKVELMADAPGPQYVWIDGYWHWGWGQYAWVAGRWELPPRENAIWMPPRWETQGESLVLIHGYWS